MCNATIVVNQMDPQKKGIRTRPRERAQYGQRTQSCGHPRGLKRDKLLLVLAS